MTTLEIVGCELGGCELGWVRTRLGAKPASFSSTFLSERSNKLKLPPSACGTSENMFTLVKILAGSTPKKERRTRDDKMP